MTPLATSWSSTAPWREFVGAFLWEKSGSSAPSRAARRLLTFPPSHPLFSLPPSTLPPLSPFYEAPRASRDCYKGKQIITKTHLPDFSKLEYAPEPYEGDKKEQEKKKGFGTVSMRERERERERSSTLPPLSLPSSLS